jgi:hypothetical protein
MQFTRSLSLAVAMASISAPGFAKDDSHQAHHPAVAATAPVTKPTPDKPRPDMARMDSQMTAMMAMHDKMMAARTPAERDALMAEHMKVMQDGMTMIKSMSPGGTSGTRGDMASRHQMMERRMDMMQATMQMMMDRLPAAPAK